MTHDHHGFSLNGDVRNTDRHPTGAMDDRSVATSDDHSSCRCVPSLMVPIDRMVTLRNRIATETEPVVSLTHLLRLCRDEHPTLWEHHAARIAAKRARQT